MPKSTEIRVKLHHQLEDRKLTGLEDVLVAYAVRGLPARVASDMGTFYVLTDKATIDEIPAHMHSF